MKKYLIKFTGRTPLLMHMDNIEWADKMEEWKNDPANKKKSKAGDDRTPAFRWIGCLYHDEKLICIPQENIMRCIMEGATLVLVPGGKSGKTFKAQTQSGMMTTERFWPLTVNGDTTISWEDINLLLDEESFAEHSSIVQSLGFSLFTKRAKVGTSKHIRVRPKFDNWSVQGEIVVWDDQITIDVLQNIVQYAGQYKGLCDWRPGAPKSPGPFGIFDAEVKEI